MNKTTLQVTVDEETKNISDKVLSQLGLDLSDAVNIFLKQVALQGGLPFEVKLNEHNAVIEIKQNRDNIFAVKNMDEIEDAILEDVNNILAIGKFAKEFDKCFITSGKEWFKFGKSNDKMNNYIREMV